MKILELALENHLEPKEKEDEKLIVMQGPLSDILCRALNHVYKKGGAEYEYDFSLESQAQDVVLTKKIVDAVVADDSEDTPDYVVFGVEKTSIEPEDLVQVKSILDTKDDKTRLVLFSRSNDVEAKSKELSDTRPQGNLDGLYSNMSAAMESLVQARGGVIVGDLQSLCNVII